MSSKRKTPSVAIASEENNTVRSKRVKRKTEFYAKSSVNFKANGVLKSVKSTASADLIDLTDDRIEDIDSNDDCIFVCSSNSSLLPKDSYSLPDA